MTSTFSSLRINADRMLDAFNQLAAIGGTADSGVHRPTFSEAHLTARAWFREHIEASGFEFRTDGAGNHSAILPCDDPSAPTLILGSHLDSVPNGGRFDGALGVMAALEVLKTVRENGIKLKVQLEAMDFHRRRRYAGRLAWQRCVGGTSIQRKFGETARRTRTIVGRNGAGRAF
jgi:beta-ureidopropionase / N-carbamoyl-L-amino-acid hydrolase